MAAGINVKNITSSSVGLPHRKDPLSPGRSFTYTWEDLLLHISLRPTLVALVQKDILLATDVATGETLTAFDVQTRGLNDAAAVAYSTQLRTTTRVLGHINGEATIAELNAIEGINSFVFAVLDAGHPNGSSDVLVAGDIVQFQGDGWKKIHDGENGHVADGATFTVAPSDLTPPFSEMSETPLFKIARYSAAERTWKITEPKNGDSVVVVAGSFGRVEGAGAFYMYDSISSPPWGEPNPIELASPSASGLMSASDKENLDALYTERNHSWTASSGIITNTAAEAIISSHDIDNTQGTLYNNSRIEYEQWGSLQTTGANLTIRAHIGPVSAEGSLPTIFDSSGFSTWAPANGDMWHLHGYAVVESADVGEGATFKSVAVLDVYQGGDVLSFPYRDSSINVNNAEGLVFQFTVQWGQASMNHVATQDVVMLNYIIGSPE